MIEPVTRPTRPRPDTGEACLTVRGVTKTYRTGPETVYAVVDATLELRSGELVLLVGSSGSGKSTLLHIAAGLEPVEEGYVEVKGSPLTGVSPKKVAAARLRHVGVVFQDGNLIDELTASENVALPLEVARVGRTEARQAALNALELVGLAGLGGRLPSQLSGGQRQRVAVARAVAGSQRVLLADEPTGSLDSAAGQQVMAVIRRACDAGAAALVATHDLRNATFADRVLEMSDGRLGGSR